MNEIRLEKEADLIMDMLSAAENSQHTALVYQDQSYTYSQLVQAVRLCARDFKKMGIQPGNHVALWAYNSVNWLIAFFGIIYAGGVAVLANYDLRCEELAKLLNFTDVRYLVWGDNKETVRDLQAVKKLGAALKLDASHTYDIRASHINYLERIQREDCQDNLMEKDDGHRTAIIIFTSGSTSKPKAVQQSQGAVLHNARQAMKRLEASPLHKMLLALPLFHSYGLCVVFCCLSVGAVIYIPNNLSPDELVRNFIQYQITEIFSVSVLYSGIIAHPRFKKEVAPIVRFCGTGGGFSSEEQLQHFARSFPNAGVFCGYGQTEACTLISAPYPGDCLENCIFSVGKPLDDLYVEIHDAKGQSLPAGTTGEIVVKGKSLMNGYYKLTEEEQTIDKDGWLHTEDLGYLDKDGNLHLAGRLKDIIIKEGENIAPAEIEAAIYACGGVSEVRVLGIPNPGTGESVEACMIPMDGSSLDISMLQKQMKTRLPSFKMPDHLWLFEHFPKGANGKIDQHALRKEVLERLGRETEK